MGPHVPRALASCVGAERRKVHPSLTLCVDAERCSYVERVIRYMAMSSIGVPTTSGTQIGFSVHSVPEWTVPAETRERSRKFPIYGHHSTSSAHRRPLAPP